MFNNVHDDKQLSLNFEFSQVEECPAKTAPVSMAMSVRSRLELVVNNRTNVSRLSPDSVEITRILAGQAKTLGW
ncbi:hypothetical protein [Janthinobacterium sp. NKUCC06_STL]|jgi:hypothetical protein|uniref:hypothetical protein n=1 Tax=Janthinobacterium sp. NKUCC06_STL TaxID=2842127 RepID=UPI000F9345FC|nr:hypothetical protein [Janthinobacterium sp. NKUCC06_STL]MBW3509863.1 hypothetical protein [Janthinobacterium sp. NKUCC06_STL]